MVNTKIMQEKIYFKSSSGVRVCGILSNPTGDANRPVIILCHGFATSKDGKKFVRLEQLFNEKNISTLRFDFFGRGESGGEFEDMTISKAVDDVLSAIEYLKSLKYSKIGLIGSSFGGLASIMTASKTDNLYTLGLISPVSNYKECGLPVGGAEKLKKWKKVGYIDYIKSDGRKLKLNYTYFEDCDNNDGYEAGKKIKIPTIIVHGDKNEDVPIGQSQKIANIIPDCQLEIIKGAGHKYSKPEEFEKMIDLIAGFIIERS